MLQGKAEWQLDRTGEFHVHTHGQFHCGTTAELTIRYNLSVVTSTDSLDDRGFLFDQTRIQSMLDKQNYNAVSCERFTQQLARYLYREVKQENPALAISRFSLTLSPAPYAASITFRWNAEPTEIRIPLAPKRLERESSRVGRWQLRRG